MNMIEVASGDLPDHLNYDIDTDDLIVFNNMEFLDYISEIHPS